MMAGINLKVTSEPDDDGLYKYEITITNDSIATSLAFYEYVDFFRDFGQKLKEFPKTTKDIVTYELLKDDRMHAYYMQLKVFCHQPNGQTAIMVITDNHSVEPNHQRSEFYITTVPASINQLGQGLENWNPQEVKEFNWKAES